MMRPCKILIVDDESFNVDYNVGIAGSRELDQLRLETLF